MGTAEEEEKTPLQLKYQLEKDLISNWRPTTKRRNLAYAKEEEACEFFYLNLKIFSKLNRRKNKLECV